MLSQILDARLFITHFSPSGVPITPGSPIASLEKDEIFFNEEGKEGRKEGRGEDISFPSVVEKFLEVEGAV